MPLFTDEPFNEVNTELPNVKPLSRLTLPVIQENKPPTGEEEPLFVTVPSHFVLSFTLHLSNHLPISPPIPTLA